MTSPVERPTSYQANPEQYLVDHVNAIPDKNRAHELALMTDYSEARSASLRLGLKAIMDNSIRKKEDGSRYILVFDGLEAIPNISDDMRNALMEDACYTDDEYPEEFKNLAGSNVATIFSVEAALDAIEEANTASQTMYDEGNLLLDELDETKR